VKRPQRFINGCLECDGLGVWSEDDWDGEDSRVVKLRCEACEGTGLVSDCECCDEPTGLPSLELLGGICGACAAMKEVGT
jgi:hypothetical protein